MKMLRLYLFCGRNGKEKIQFICCGYSKCEPSKTVAKVIRENNLPLKIRYDKTRVLEADDFDKYPAFAQIVHNTPHVPFGMYFLANS